MATKPQTLTLTDFLLARLAEDEALAAAVPSPVTTGGRLDTLTGRARARFVAQWQPARVLADVEAKRRIVKRYRWAADDQAWTRDMELQDWGSEAEETLCDLAQPYADHPDYREEWRA